MDTNCYVELLTAHDEDKARAVRDLVEGHKKNHEVILPEIVRLETLAVASKGRNGEDGGLKEKREDNFNKIKDWLWGKKFLFTDFRNCSSSVEDAIFEYGLKAPDAIIFATAKDYRAQLFTYDSDLLQLNGECGVEVAQPPASQMLI